MAEHKISDDVLEQLKQLQEKFMELTINLGKGSLERINTKKRLEKINSNIDEMENNYDVLLKEQDDIIDTLHKQYGDGQVDLETGKFIQINE